jgi:hypothetical protein
MEAFESFVAIALEAEGLVVSEALKFRVPLQTQKTAYKEIQTHGYEVDLVGARSDRLVLATVKSFFGSRGVAAEHVTGTTADQVARKRYRLLNDPELRSAVVSAAAERFGYETSQVRLRLYAGKFAGPAQGIHEQLIRDWCASQFAGGGPIEVIGIKDVLARVLDAAAHTQYRDNPVLVTMKVLETAGLLAHSLPPTPALVGGSGISVRRAGTGTAAMSLLLAPSHDVESVVQGDVARGRHLSAYQGEIIADLRVPHDLEDDLPDITATAAQRTPNEAVL